MTRRIGRKLDGTRFCTRNVPLTSAVIGWTGSAVGKTPVAAVWVIAMPFHIEQVAWMPSPPLVPDDGPIDFAHLRTMTLGDARLEREVLAMFAAQAAELGAALAALPADTAALAHKLKGSARAVGAFRVAEAASDLETAARTDGAAVALAALKETLREACEAIGARLNRS
jgi:HPt (histidine-containing phosphotransfer) domain-containing protein